MKSSKNGASAFKRSRNLLLMLFAVLCATVMWYYVSVRDRLEAQVEVNIDYYGIPPNLVITDGLINKITVRLRGPETLLRSLPRQSLNEAINLSQIKKGPNVVPMGGDLGPAFRAFEIIDIMPPRIDINADTLVERSVPLRPIPESPLVGGVLTVENVTVSPATVVLRGPEKVISGIPTLPLYIHIDPRVKGGESVEQMLTLDTPAMVTANPTIVRIGYTMTSGRTDVSRVCRVTLAGDSTHEYAISPSEISIIVEVPDALSKNESYLAKLTASVVPPPLNVRESKKIKPHLQMPDGMSIINMYPDEITITKTKE